jgi:hypothetical protein
LIAKRDIEIRNTKLYRMEKKKKKLCEYLRGSLLGGPKSIHSNYMIVEILVKILVLERKIL